MYKREVLFTVHNRHIILPMLKCFRAAGRGTSKAARCTKIRLPHRGVETAPGLRLLSNSGTSGWASEKVLAEISIRSKLSYRNFILCYYTRQTWCESKLLEKICPEELRSCSRTARAVLVRIKCAYSIFFLLFFFTRPRILWQPETSCRTLIASDAIFS